MGRVVEERRERVVRTRGERRGGCILAVEVEAR